MIYTDKEIAQFLKAADRDLGSGKYKGDEMIPDYARAVIIGKQLQAKIERLEKCIKELKQAFNESTTIANSFVNELWQRDRAKAKSIHDTLQAAFDLYKAAIAKAEKTLKGE